MNVRNPGRLTTGTIFLDTALRWKLEILTRRPVMGGGIERSQRREKKPVLGRSALFYPRSVRKQRAVHNSLCYRCSLRSILFSENEQAVR